MAIYSCHSRWQMILVIDILCNRTLFLVAYRPGSDPSISGCIPSGGSHLLNMTMQSIAVSHFIPLYGPS